MNDKAPETILLRKDTLRPIINGFEAESDYEAIGLLFSAVFHYADDGSVSDEILQDKNLSMLFNIIKSSVDADIANYQRKTAKQSEATTARWKKESFAKLWAEYPRKDGEQEAQSVFEEISVKLDEVLSDLKYYKAESPDFKNGNPPLLADWLKDRWLKDRFIQKR